MEHLHEGLLFFARVPLKNRLKTSQYLSRKEVANAAKHRKQGRMHLYLFFPPGSSYPVVGAVGTNITEALAGLGVPPEMPLAEAIQRMGLPIGTEILEATILPDAKIKVKDSVISKNTHRPGKVLWISTDEPYCIVHWADETVTPEAFEGLYLKGPELCREVPVHPCVTHDSHCS